MPIRSTLPAFCQQRCIAGSGRTCPVLQALPRLSRQNSVCLKAEGHAAQRTFSTAAPAGLPTSALPSR